MNTTIRLVTSDWRLGTLLREAARLIRDIESQFSRFRSDSELSRLNESGGAPFAASPGMISLLSQAQRFAGISQGAFEPAVLPQLEASGYDRSFELIEPRSAGTLAPLTTHTSIRYAEIDVCRGTVRLPKGTRLDLGGIGKGYAVDQAAAVLRDAGDFLIDAGGDIYAEGVGPDGDGWYVAVEDPSDPERDTALVCLNHEAIATSSTLRRRWQVGDPWRHHLIDPRTGQAADTGVIAVSAIAATAIAADVMAKSALILGPCSGKQLLERYGCIASLFLSGGAALLTEGWAQRNFQFRSWPE